MRNKIKRKIKRIITHKNVRFTVYLRWSILLSVLMALFKITAGLITSSAWLLFAGMYYSVLCLARIFILYEDKRIKDIQIKRERFLRAFRDYRYTGFILMILTLPYLLMCVRMFRFGEFERHMTFVAVAFAIIAIIKLLSCIVGLYNTKNYHTPLLSSLKRINFCDSLVSITMTQAALSALFCEGRFTPFSLICGIGTAVITFLLGYKMLNKYLDPKR